MSSECLIPRSYAIIHEVLSYVFPENRQRELLVVAGVAAPILMQLPYMWLLS